MFQRGHHADLHLHLVVRHQLLGEREELPRHFHRLHAEHVVPGRFSHVRERVGDRRAKLHVADVPIDLGDRDALAVAVCPHVFHQRLRGLWNDQFVL